MYGDRWFIYVKCFDRLIKDRGDNPCLSLLQTFFFYFSEAVEESQGHF